MRTRVARLGTLAVLGTAACDPVYGMHLRQPLQPRPALECIARALSASPRVAEAKPRPATTREGFYVALRDSLAPRGYWAGEVTRETAARDSAGVVSVSYHWMSYAEPEEREQARMAASAAALLAELRAACAPASPPAVECVRTGPFVKGTCRAAEREAGQLP